MTMKSRLVLMISVCSLLSACFSSEPGATGVTDFNCSETTCDAEIVIYNPGADSFEINYQFEAFASGTTASVGEWAGTYVIAGNHTQTLSKQFAVTSKPNQFATSVEITRLR